MKNSINLLHCRVSEISEAQSTVSKIYQLRAATASVVSKSKSRTSFASSDGSMVTSTISGEIGEPTAPLLVEFSQMRLSELAKRVEGRKNGESSPSRESPSDDEEEEMVAKKGSGSEDRKNPFFRIPQKYELSSTSTPIKLRKPSKQDMEKYRSTNTADFVVFL